MIRVCVKFLLFIYMLLFFSALAHAQESPTMYIMVESGGNIDFKVYSLHYYENGMSLDWGKLRLEYDTTDINQNNEWYLGVTAQDSKFLSSNPDQDLSLDKVTLEVEDLKAEDEFGSELEKDIELTHGSYATIVDGADVGFYRLKITYHLDSLLGHPPGYYNTNLIFRMDTTEVSTW
ncbi:MAG: hypothetical protein ACLFUW_08000 [Bacteroidales bacterium]